MANINDVLATIRRSLKLETKEQWSSFEKLFVSSLSEVDKEYLLLEPPEEGEKDAVRVSNCIGMCLGDQVRNKITFWNQDLRRPDLIWQALKDVFGEDQNKDLNEAIEKLNSLHTMRMGEAEQFFNELQMVKVQLSVLGKDFGDDVFRAWTLAALPDGYANLRMRLGAAGFREVQKEVISEDKRKLARTEKEKHTGQRREFGGKRHYQEGAEDKESGDGPGDSKRPTRICYRCREPGHIARDCKKEEASLGAIESVEGRGSK